MNKLFILLLAVCLVSVHAFVKRDAPEAAKPDQLEEFKKNIEAMAKTFADGVKDALDPEAIKKNFNAFIDTTSAQINKFKEGGAAKKE